MAQFKDLTGERFGRLEVIGLARKQETGKRCRYYWTCKCDCGKYHEARTDCLTQGMARSCGCMHREQATINLQKHHSHKMSNSRLYHIWQKMKDRCYTKNNPSYPNWGGRGIAICDEWRSNFTAFYEWSIANGYDDTKTIDRINNNGNYEPSNCRWATNREQSRNRRTNVIVEYNGEKMTLIEAAEKSNIPYGTLCTRYNKGDVGEKLFRPVLSHGEKRVVKYEGKDVTLRELSDITGINYNTLKTRYRLGKPLTK